MIDPFQSVKTPPTGSREADVPQWPSEGGPLPGSGGAGEAGTTTCLYSNNSTSAENRPLASEDLQRLSALCGILPAYHKKQAHLLFSKVHRLIEYVAPSIHHVAFLTLTFADNVTDNKEASRRWDSFNTHFLKPHPEYGSWILTKEVQTRGAWHYHILIETKGDVLTGFDFDAYREWLTGNNRFHSPCPTGNDYIRSLWSELLPALTSHNFGMIFSLEPIASNAEAMGRYVGKYISKHIANRDPDHKGVRLISSSQGLGGGNMHFAWNNKNAAEWRRKLALFAQVHGCDDLYQLADKLGPRWAYIHQDDICNIDRILEENGGCLSAPYQDKTLTRIPEKRKKREKADRERLNLIRRKTDRQKRKDQARATVSRLLIQKYQPPESTETEPSARNAPLIDDRMIAREWANKLNPEKQEQPPEVPF